MRLHQKQNLMKRRKIIHNSSHKQRAKIKYLFLPKPVKNHLKSTIQRKPTCNIKEVLSLQQRVPQVKFRSTLPYFQMAVVLFMSRQLFPQFSLQLSSSHLNHILFLWPFLSLYHPILKFHGPHLPITMISEPTNNQRATTP